MSLEFVLLRIYEPRTSDLVQMTRAVSGRLSRITSLTTFDRDALRLSEVSVIPHLGNRRIRFRTTTGAYLARLLETGFVQKMVGGRPSDALASLRRSAGRFSEDGPQKGCSETGRGSALPSAGPTDGQRAHLNFLENLLPFAIVVLCARAIGVSNSLTVLGAEIFLIARLVHVASYAAGATIVRTIAHHTGTLGTLLVAFELFAHSP